MLTLLVACITSVPKPADPEPHDSSLSVDTSDEADTGETGAGETGDDETGHVGCDGLDSPLAMAVPVSSTCEAGVPADPWRLRVEWELQTLLDSDDSALSWAQPVVGHLTDDDGDGVFGGTGDVPEIVAVIDLHVVALDGATGEVRWAVMGENYRAALALADLDSDGSPEIVVASPGNDLLVLDAAGVEQSATSSVPYVVGVMHGLDVADLTGDGEPEIVANGRIFARDGSVLVDLEAPMDTGMEHPSIIADIDLNGDREILSRGRLLGSSGELIFDAGIDSRDGFIEWPAFVQADDDSALEWIWVAEDWTLHDDDGTELLRVERSERAGPPCVGDLDGDGGTDLVIAGETALTAWRLDGTERWSVPIDQNGTVGGCSTFDLDGDGALEIIVADDHGLLVFSHEDGAKLLSERFNRVYTPVAAPVVADVDGDGDAEIVVVDSYRYGGAALTVFGHDGTGWLGGASTWPSLNMDGGANVLDDLSVPPTMPEFPNRLRAGTTTSVAPTPPDLGVQITDVCVADCLYGPVALSLQVDNHGPGEARAGTPVAIYAIDGGERRLVHTLTLPTIPSGYALDSITVELAVTDLGHDGFAVVVDSDGILLDWTIECTEDDAEAVWTEPLCP